MGNFCIVDALLQEMMMVSCLRIFWEYRKVDRSELHCRYYKCLRTCRLIFPGNLEVNSFFSIYVTVFVMQILVAHRNNSSVAGYFNLQKNQLLKVTA